MKENDPWIEAALAAFPEDELLNAERRELLAAASVAVPPRDPDDPAGGDPPARFLARARTSRRRALVTNTILFLIALGILWFQLLSPTARRDTRRILIASNPYPGQYVQNYAIPDIILPADPEAALREEVELRIPPDKHLLCLGDKTAPDAIMQAPP
jgi:hypothetical protein